MKTKREFDHKVTIRICSWQLRAFLDWCKHNLGTLNVLPSKRTWDYSYSHEEKVVLFEFSFQDDGLATLMKLSWS